MICDICGVTIGTANRITVRPSKVVAPTKRGYVPTRLPPTWKPQCEQLGISIASHWKTVVEGNSSVDWYLCRSCKDEIDRFERTGAVRPTKPVKPSPAPSSKEMWQCPKCGGILQKQRETIEIKDKVGVLLGSATCSYCSTNVPASAVYEGQFDFADPDERIRQVTSDRENMQFDPRVMRWHYKSEVVPLACDIDESGPTEEQSRKWWQFWR